MLCSIMHPEAYSITPNPAVKRWQAIRADYHCPQLRFVGAGHARERCGLTPAIIAKISRARPAPTTPGFLNLKEATDVCKHEWPANSFARPVFRMLRYKMVSFLNLEP
jgi:hypothetical protein